jgi:hypothetical protein
MASRIAARWRVLRSMPEGCRAQLGRPRVDVVITPSGLYRDALPLLIELLDQAMSAVKDLPEDDNPIRPFVQSTRQSLEARADDGDDPILSVVNIVDVFLVVIAVLLIAVIENPLNAWAMQDGGDPESRPARHGDAGAPGQRAEALPQQRPHRRGRRAEDRHRLPDDGRHDGLRARVGGCAVRSGTFI